MVHFSTKYLFRVHKCVKMQSTLKKVQKDWSSSGVMASGLANGSIRQQANVLLAMAFLPGINAVVCVWFLWFGF